MAGYFKDIWIGVTTVLVGMRITLGHWFKFKKAVTIQYPHETLEMNERTRARLFNVADDCAVCLACVRACPVNIITIKGVRAGKDEDLGMLPNGKPKKMHLIQFDIDFAKCVYCGLCVDVCESASLDWRTPVEVCTFTRDEMYLKFATIPPEEVERLLLAEEERKKASAATKAAGAKPGGKPPVRKPKPPTDDTSGDQGPVAETEEPDGPKAKPEPSAPSESGGELSSPETAGEVKSEAGSTEVQEQSKTTE